MAKSGFLNIDPAQTPMKWLLLKLCTIQTLL